MPEKEFRKFIFPFNWSVYAAGLFIAFFSILMISLGGPGIIILVILLAVYVYYVLKRYRSYKDLLNSHAQQGDLESISLDFASAKSWFKDSIRTGKLYVYCKRQPVLYAYTDILNLYEYEHRTNFVTDQRCLCAVIRGGERVRLCDIRTTLKQNPEAMQLLQTLLARNPSITLGYENSKVFTKENK